LKFKIHVLLIKSMDQMKMEWVFPTIKGPPNLQSASSDNYRSTKPFLEDHKHHLSSFLTYVYIHAYICVCMHACLCARACVYMCVCVRMYIYIHIQILIVKIHSNSHSLNQNFSYFWLKLFVLWEVKEAKRTKNLGK